MTEDTFLKIAIIAAPILLMLVMFGAASTRYSKPVGWDDECPRQHPPLGNYGPNNEDLPDISTGWHIFADGNAWCAVGPAYVDLQQSLAGFGYTHAEAYRDLMRVLIMRDPGYLNHRPRVADFHIHLPTVKPDGR